MYYYYNVAKSANKLFNLQFKSFTALSINTYVYSCDTVHFINEYISLHIEEIDH